MKTYFLPSIIGLIIIFSATFALSVANAFNLAQGPDLIEIEPKSMTVVTDPLVTISGKTERIDRLYFNNRQIFANPEGHFSETLLLLPGYNILTLRAEDRFERQVIKRLELVYQPEF